MARCRCKMPDGITIKPDGEHELDPCTYVLKEIHRNVTVEILQCKECGHIPIGWYPQEDTEDEYLGELSDDMPDGDETGVQIQMKQEEIIEEEEDNDET